MFLFCGPLSGWRAATTRQRRSKSDWALDVASLLDGRYADCEKVTLVLDNLNTHTLGAFHEAFEPSPARDLVRRIGDLETLRTEIAAWSAHVNTR